MGRSRRRENRKKDGLSERQLRRYVLFLLLPCLLVLVAAVVLLSGKLGGLFGGGSGTASERTVKTAENLPLQELMEPDTKEYFQDFGGSILTRDGVPEISQLMVQYFQSISQCDMGTFLHLFTSQDTSGEEEFRQEFEQQSQYIEGYQNITCYTVPGIGEGEYAAYVSYEICYRDVETPAPSLVRIYAKLCGDGQYRIYDEAMTPELESYLEQLSENEDVRLLGTQIDRAFREAVEADPALKERVEYMEKGPDYMQEQ